MKYLPTINLWDAGVQTALLNGQLKLQSGQWVHCGNTRDHKSRFVRVTKGGCIHVAHWQGNGKDTLERYNQLNTIGRRV